MSRQIDLYDTTLRDGMQGEGMSLSADEKVRVAHALDRLGIQFIEAGFPSSNPKEEALFELLARRALRELPDLRVRHDPAARPRGRATTPRSALLADSFAPVCTLVGKTWKLHLEKVIHTDPAENLDLIRDSVAFLASRGKRVIYDAEHFFDAYRDDAEYALRCLAAALEAGAENVTLCDTNGSSLPSQVAEATARARRRVRRRAGRDPHPQRRRVRGGQLPRGGRAGRRRWCRAR